MLKRGLEDREVGTAIDKLFGLLHHQAHLAVEWNLDGLGRAVKLLGDLPYPVAHRKQRLGPGRDLGVLGMMHLQMQPLRTLPGRDELGFGEVGLSRQHGEDSTRG